MRTYRKRVYAAEDEMMNETVQVDESASDLLFEAEDVAELVAEVTGQPVEVTTDEDSVVFSVGDNEFTVEADGDEETVESCTRTARRRVAASTRRPAARGRYARRTVAASTRRPAARARRVTR